MVKKNEKISEIKDFFKSNVNVDNIMALLELPPYNLVGIDNISTQILLNNNINSIEDLSNLSTESLPTIEDIPQNTLIKWIKIAKILKKNILEKAKTEKKILVIGLDNGGKTSLLDLLKNKFTMWKASLPTRGVKREQIDFFNYPIISWDLGGQEEYRESYFNKPKTNFLGASLIVYVVDIQDEKRFDLSVDYFERILQVLLEMEEPTKFVIALNKSDPNIIDTTKFIENTENIKEKFNQTIKKYKEIDYFFANTSIFRVETVINLFSSVLKRISETTEIIENILTEFAENTNLRAISLIAMEGLVFGSYYNDPNDEILLNNSAIILQMLESFYNSRGLTKEGLITHELPNNKLSIRGQFLFEFYSYKNIKSPVYLWMIADRFEKVDNYLENAREQLLPLVKIFL